MFKSKLLFLAIISVQCALANNITLSDYGTLGGTTAYATGINASGQVVGYSTTSSGATHAFLLSAGHMIDLGTLSTSNGASYAEGINDAGTVVGFSTLTGSINNHAFSFSAGHMTDIDGTSGASYAYAINDSGQIAGAQATSIYGTPHGFLDTAGSFANTGAFAGIGINASGVMVSTISSGRYSHAATYTGGVTTDLGSLAGFNSYGNAINASGQVVGKSDYNAFNYTHAFLYSGGVMTDLGTLGGNHSEAMGINSYGQVVGDAYSTDPKYLYGIPRPTQTDHAFLYANGQMIDLNDYISSTLNIDLIQAVGINDSGIIAINGTIANGSHHFFVMDTNGAFAVTSATPEPSSILLASAGALLLAFYRRRRV